MNDEQMLQVEDVAHSFGGVQAVSGASLTVGSGKFLGLIGPNGAGKSTLLDCISGNIKNYSGRVVFNGEQISGLPMYKVARRGLVRSFQSSRVFGRLTVTSNLMTAPRGQKGERLVSALFGGWRKQDDENLLAAQSLVDDFGLGHLADMYAEALSGGQRRLTELTRALMLRPKMLLLDEPFAGVSPVNRQNLARWLRDLNKHGELTILMVEHRLEMVEQLCDSVVVMAEGRVIAQDSMEELRRNPHVVEAYLGTVHV
jgi:branched-chain amino acid transport system ATP-binding protein